MRSNLWIILLGILSFSLNVFAESFKALECAEESVYINQKNDNKEEGTSFQLVCRNNQIITHLKNTKAIPESINGNEYMISGNQFHSYCYNMINHHDYHLNFSLDWCLDNYYFDVGYRYIWIGYDEEKSEILLEVYDNDRNKIAGWIVNNCRPNL